MYFQLSLSIGFQQRCLFTNIIISIRSFLYFNIVNTKTNILFNTFCNIAKPCNTVASRISLYLLFTNQLNTNNTQFSVYLTLSAFFINVAMKLITV